MESVLVFAIILIAVIAAAGPVIASGVAGGFNLSAENPAEYARQYFFAHPFLVAYLLFLISVAGLAALVVHSWIEAGSFGTYMEGERRAERVDALAPDRFTVFTIDLWFAQARLFWRRFFVLYNVVWSIYLLLIMLPLLAIATAVVLTGATQAGMVAGCVVLVTWALVALVSSLITQAWSHIALAAMVDQSLSVRQALRVGWSLLWRRLGDVLAGVLVIIGISLLMGVVASAFFVGMSMFDDLPGGELILFPFQLILSFTQLFFSLFLSGWITAAFVAIVARAPLTSARPDIDP
ncbi:MAG TPA: hypothetical protein VNM92_09285 [Thermoanaerobaculia bacterium]|nr:hypothetical protein [Thermoanaerobaculia bacterium]